MIFVHYDTYQDLDIIIIQSDEVEQEGDGADDVECALNKSAVVFKYKPNKREKYDLLLTLEGKKKTIIKQLKTQLKKHRGIKWFVSVETRVVRSNPEGRGSDLNPPLSIHLHDLSQ